MGGIPLENPGIQSDFCWILLDFYRDCNFFRDKEVVQFFPSLSLPKSGIMSNQQIEQGGTNFMFEK